MMDGLRPLKNPLKQKASLSGAPASTPTTNQEQPAMTNVKAQ
jgi:hypothetical protein